MRDFKDRLKKGDRVLGVWCDLPSPHVINVMAKTGLDFAIIDMEHGFPSFETVDAMIKATEVEGCTAMVRVAKNDESYILKALDMNAKGVLIPHIESVEDAHAAINFSKYHPKGMRGFTSLTRAGGYSLHNVATHCGKQNDRTVVGLLLEGKKGIKNIDKILAMDEIGEVDFIYIGAYDLSQAFGHPGCVDHPAVKKALETCVKKIRARGLAAGGYVAKDEKDMQWMCAMGMQVITLLPDCTVLFHAYEKLCMDFQRVVSNKRGTP